MDLSQLSAIHIAVRSIAFSPQSAGAVVTIHPVVQIVAEPAMLLAAGAD